MNLEKELGRELRKNFEPRTTGATLGRIEKVSSVKKLHGHMALAESLAARVQALHDALLGPVPENGATAGETSAPGGSIGNLLLHGKEADRRIAAAMDALGRLERELVD